MLGNEGGKLEYFMLNEFLDFKPEHVEDIFNDIRFASVRYSLWCFHTVVLSYSLKANQSVLAPMVCSTGASQVISAPQACRRGVSDVQEAGSISVHPPICSL
jgi:hypothetical protein